MRALAMPQPRFPDWDVAVKIGTVLALVLAFLRWLLTPVWLHAVRKALAPEIKALRDANARDAATTARLDAHEHRLGVVEDDLRALRDRVDDLADGRSG
jgi:CBS domain containing-hemolysin-like protein